MKIKWLDEPEECDYPAAAEYLSLHFPPDDVERLIKRLRKAKVVRRKVKDIWRASGLPLLPKSNEHVREDLRKIRKGKALSPLLLVAHYPLIVADGAHRMSTIYHYGEDEEVPNKIASL